MIQYNIIVSERTQQMLAGHIRFLAQKSPDAARRVKTDLLNSILSLSQMPERFPFLNNDFITPNKYHKMIVAKRYLVLYQIKEQTVYVDYVVDCRQDYAWLIQ